MPCYTTAAVAAKAVIYKLLSLNYFVLFALNGLYWFHKKIVNHFFHWRKKIVTNVTTPVFVCFFFSTVKRKVSCALPKISRLLSYKQIIAWPARSIWQYYRLVMLQNFPNTSRRFAARGILDNFEISLAVLLPNTTTSHAITYTNRLHIIIFSTNKLWQDWLLFLWWLLAMFFSPHISQILWYKTFQSHKY